MTQVRSKSQLISQIARELNALLKYLHIQAIILESYYENICLSLKLSKMNIQRYNVTCHRRWIPQLDPKLGFYNKNIKARTRTEPKEVRRYSDLPSGMISSWKTRILECPVMDYSNNNSITQAQPYKDKVINNVLKLYQSESG